MGIILVLQRLSSIVIDILWKDCCSCRLNGERRLRLRLRLDFRDVHSPLFMPSSGDAPWPFFGSICNYFLCDNENETIRSVIFSTGRAFIAPITAVHCYPWHTTAPVRLPTVVPPPPSSVGAGVALAFSKRSNHQFNIEASLDCDSTSKRNNTNIIMDESVTLPDAVVAAAEATDCDATTVHRIRQNKQSLRKIIRSRIKSAYPNNNDNTESYPITDGM